MEVLIGYAIFSVFTLVGILAPSGVAKTTSLPNPNSDNPKLSKLNTPSQENQGTYEETPLVVTTNNLQQEKALVTKTSIAKLRFIPPVKKVELRSKFGYRIHPITKKRKFHAGVDLDGHKGDPILAVGNGVVSFVGKQRGYGNVIQIKHADGWWSKYAHLSKVLVRKNEVIKAGAKIGEMGKSGFATGVHLHFELHHKKKVVNPAKFIRLQ